MLDIAYIIEHQDLIRQTISDKQSSLDLDELIAVYTERNEIIGAVETLRHQRNEHSSKMQSASDDERATLIEEGKRIKEEIASVEPKLDEVEGRFRDLMYQVPNVCSEATPVGKDESGNVEIRKEGSAPEFSFEPKDHIDLMESCDLVDFERGVKVHGFRGYFLKNEAVLLQHGLMQLCLTTMREHGFTIMTTPSVVREQPLYNTGHFPGAREEVFALESADGEEGEAKEQKYLAGTAEVPLVSYHSGETLTSDQLPIKMCAISPCFRSEVGSYGKDTRGLYRIHEFLKVEQVVLCENNIETSSAMFEDMMSIAEGILQKLGLHYRVLQICTGDMGTGKHHMCDIESWMPGRGSFGETHSCSNLTDWQSRRANIKYKDEEGTHFTHCLNNTVAASPRILIALIEQYQNEDGSITVPETLREYVGTDVIHPVQ